MHDVVLNAQQLKCLASPACSDVLQALRQVGPASARELATRLGRSVGTVHYHLKCLVECDLAREAFRRPTARKPEAVFEKVGDRLQLPLTEESEDLRRQAVLAGMRQAMRGYDRAVQSSRGALSVLRVNVRLSAEDAETFVGMLEAASKFASERRIEDGAPLHWHSIVYPD